MLDLQRTNIKQSIGSSSYCFALFFSALRMSTVWIGALVTCSLFSSMEVNAAPSATELSPTCQKAKKQLHEHFDTEKAVRDDVVVFTQMDKLSQAEIELAYLGIKLELLLLAKKGVLHQCDLSDLASAGLQINVSEDGQFRVYDWATDYEVEDSLGYSTVMYAQPKQPNFHPADYINKEIYPEISHIITIAQPTSEPTSEKTWTSKYSIIDDTNFPLYGVVGKSFARGQHRIHCAPWLSLFQVRQNKRLGYITEIDFKYLDANGKEIDMRYFFVNGCDGDDDTKRYIADNQFHYDAKTSMLSFRLSVMTDFDEQSPLGRYGYEHYRFRFNGKDFVQVDEPIKHLDELPNTLTTDEIYRSN